MTFSLENQERENVAPPNSKAEQAIQRLRLFKKNLTKFLRGC